MWNACGSGGLPGEDVELPDGYAGRQPAELQSDDELLEQYADECRAATAAVADLRLADPSAWWFEDGVAGPHSCLSEVLLHVDRRDRCARRTPGHCREVDGGQRLVLDRPNT